MVISFVIPLFDCEKLVRRCLDSIFVANVDRKQYEVIVVDDGSRDRSGEICDEYARRDGRIRVIHKENEGINATRRCGVHEAKGEWVAFCDDDDTMVPDALESLYASAGGGQR
jgi:glycosyltransferase involved in cell wall biosynthesis